MSSPVVKTRDETEIWSVMLVKVKSKTGVDALVQVLRVESEVYPVGQLVVQIDSAK